MVCKEVLTFVTPLEFKDFKSWKLKRRWIKSSKCWYWS